MARIKGIAKFAANFEPEVSSALDARGIVQYKSDLYLESTWQALDGLTYTYKGMPVSVIEDGENNGIYLLVDDDYTLTNSWVKIGGSDSSGIKEWQPETGYNEGDILLNQLKLYLVTINYTSGLLIDDDIINGDLELIGGSSENSINGSVFITDIVPQGSGNVGDKIFSSDGSVLDSCLTDTNLVNVYVLALPGHSNYKPNVTINGSMVSMSSESDAPLFTGNIPIDLQSITELSVIHEDGAEHTVQITYETPPEILNAYFTGGYPGTQTELKENDTFSFYIETDVPVINVQFDDYGAYQNRLVSVPEGAIQTITDNLVSDRGNVVQNLGARVRVQKSTGSWSDWYLTENDGSVDGVNLVKLNNQYPDITITSINYTSGFEALKNTESAVVNHVIDYYDNVIYDSPNSQLDINNNSVFETNKTVSRISGDYNITVYNFRITANKISNDSTSVVERIINIAHDPATIDIISPTRLRSGGNDGTLSQDHTITINSNQRILSSSVVELNSPVGVWQGTEWGGTDDTFTRSLRIHDDIIKGSYSFTGLIFTNLAGVETTTINSGNSYTIGGFVSRSIFLDPHQNTVSMGVEVTDYTKLTLNWEVKDLPNKRPVDTTITPDPDSWSIDNLNVNPTEIIILDTQATDSSGQVTEIVIEESI